MTVLPTVRRQIEQAAQRQANPGRKRQPAAWGSAAALTGRGALTRRGPRLSAGGVIATLGVAVAVTIAVTTIALLGHRHTVRTSPATARATGRRSHVAAT